VVTGLGPLPAAGDVVSPLRTGLRASRAAIRGQLPGRYSQWWHQEYADQLQPGLRPGVTILDVGAGRNPSIPPDNRPQDCRYIGLDISRSELELSPEGWYDEYVAADVTDHVPALEGRCDLAVSYFVLEHVRSLPAAFDNIRSYLVPGGRLVVIFSGAWSVFGLANRVLPHAVSGFLLRTLLHRPTESVFPAHYNRCWASAIERCFTGWTAADVFPMWYGATYFAFARPLQAAYVGYEEWARVAGHRNLAPYYMVSAVR
jgi:SAM-dependent methyltransferase